ncbi:MAG: phospholipase [Rhodospirillales bacterium]|nr:phospholipase [Rhodospirillales bacterium]
MAELDGPRVKPASGGAARQLVVLCHGVGADGFDLIDLAGVFARALPDAAFAAPHAPFAYDQHPEGGGRQWFSIADRTPAVMAAGIRTATPLLDRFIDAELARLALPGTALALFGFSQGAMMALFAGLRRRVAPAAILAFSGALLAPETLAAERANTAPVLLVHGQDDDVVPPARSRDAEAALLAAKLPVESFFIDGLGHGIDEAGLAVASLFLQRAFA